MLAYSGQNDIAFYFIAHAIAFLVITMVYVYLNPRARVALTGLSAVIFAGFLVIVTIKVIGILK